MLRWKPCADRVNYFVPRGHGSETGSASLEFITAGVILLVPLVYLVIALSAVQGGALAVEGAARQAARVYVRAPDQNAAAESARRAVAFALEDYGLDSGDAEVQIDCSNGPGQCLDRQSLVTVTVRIGIPLPLVPDLLALNASARVPIVATSTQVVSRFGGLG